MNNLLSNLGPKSDRRFLLSGALLVIAILVLLIVMFARQRIHLLNDSKDLEATVKDGRPVRVIKATRGPDERPVAFTGEARPYATVIIYAKVSGYLREIRVDKGDRVEADQILAIIESPELNRQYDAALADAMNKRLDAERARGLFETGAISSQSYHGSETTAEIAEQTAASVLAQKDYLTVRAPFAGTITARFADPGALLQAATSAQTTALPIVSLSQTDQLRVYAYPDQKTASLVKIGDRTEVADTTRPELKLYGTVSRTSGELDLKTRTLLVETDLENPNNQILAGSFVQVTIYLRMPPYIEVPADALIIRGNETLVGIVTKENKISLRSVKIYESDGTTSRLSSGVEEGELIALNLGMSVRGGEQVRPEEKSR